MKRAEAAKKEMELALEDEKAQIAKLPFTEEELPLIEEEMRRIIAADKALIRANQQTLLAALR